MKSSIKVDLDWNNKAVIKIDKFNSDDVRDKLINQFTHCTPFFRASLDPTPGIGNGPLFDGSTVEIEAVRAADLPNLIKEIQGWIDAHTYEQGTVEDIVKFYGDTRR